MSVSLTKSTLGSLHWLPFFRVVSTSIREPLEKEVASSSGFLPFLATMAAECWSGTGRWVLGRTVRKPLVVTVHGWQKNPYAGREISGLGQVITVPHSRHMMAGDPNKPVGESRLLTCRTILNTTGLVIEIASSFT